MVVILGFALQTMPETCAFGAWSALGIVPLVINKLQLPLTQSFRHSYSSPPLKAKRKHQARSNNYCLDQEITQTFICAFEAENLLA